jgi:hypothetical protein
VVAAGVDVELARDARLHEPLREGDVLIAEQVDGADVDVRRRQPGDVGGAGRCRVLVGGLASEVPLPRLDISRPVPDPDVGDLVRRRRRVRVVDHRVDRHDEPQWRALAVACQQGGAESESAARAAAVDRQPVGVDAECDGVVRRPHQAGVAVPHRRGMGVLGGEAVLDGDDDCADLGAQHGRGGVLPGDVAENHAAAVDEEDAREHPGGVDRPVDPNGDVRIAVGAGDGAVLLGDVGVLHDREHREDLLDGRTAGDDVGDGVEATGHDLEKSVEREAALRVDQVAAGHGHSIGSGGWSVSRPLELTGLRNRGAGREGTRPAPTNMVTRRIRANRLSLRHAPGKPLPSARRLARLRR